MVTTNYQIHRRVRDYVVINLRNGFKTHPKYTYVEMTDADSGVILPDVENTKIMITDVTPNETFKMPVVYVDTVSGPEQRMLDQDCLASYEESYTNSTYLPMTVNVKVRAYDTIVRDELLDTVYQILKEYLTDLSDNGIGIRNMDFIPESREFDGDRWYYVNGITMPVITEWVETYAPTYIVIDSIEVDVSIDPESEI